MVSRMGSHGQTSAPRNWSRGLFYALPNIGVVFLMGPLTVIQGMYAKYFGLSLATIATVLLLARIFDAVSDPAIGAFSDQYYSRNGSRKIFVVAGGILFVVSSWFLFVPPADVSATYFLLCFLAFYFTHTLFEIPHLAWASEISSTSLEKNTLYGWRAFSAFFGSLLFFSVPLLPIFETNAFTPQTLRWALLLVAILMLPMLILCVLKVPNRTGSLSEKNDERSTRGKDSLKVLLKLIFNNYPLLWFLTAFFCTSVGTGMWFSLIFLFVESYLNQGDNFALVYVISYGGSILSLVVWTKLAEHLGKSVVWSLAMLIIVIGLIGTSLLSPSVTSIAPLVFCMTLIYSGFVAWTVLAPSLLADIIDYSTWKFDLERTATHFSLYTLSTKTNLAIGGALGLAIAGRYGFDATSTVHSVETVLGLQLAMAWLPTPIVLLSIVFMLLMPINPRRHAIIRRRLDDRARRKSLASNLNSEINLSLKGAQSFKPNRLRADTP